MTTVRSHSKVIGRANTDDTRWALGITVAKSAPISHDMDIEFERHEVWALVDSLTRWLRETERP